MINSLSKLIRITLNKISLYWSNIDQNYFLSSFGQNYFNNIKIKMFLRYECPLIFLKMRYSFDDNENKRRLIIFV